MKDDNAPLKAYRLYPDQEEAQEPPRNSGTFGSLMRSFKDSWGVIQSTARPPPKRILLRASPDAIKAQSFKAQAEKAAETESGLVERITETKQSAVGPFLPKFESVEQTPPADRKEQDLLILSEGLLQAMLKLDGIDIPSSEWTEARKCRKESIKMVQSYLDRVDNMRDEWKSQQQQ